MGKENEEDSQKAIGELQLLQQRLQVFAAQKQQFQLQMLEVDNAVRELSNAKAPAYKLVGEILIEKDIDTLKKELDERKKDTDMRIKSIEKQEKSIQDRSAELQKSVAKLLK